jgi:hypothetical protein
MTATIAEATAAAGLDRARLGRLVRETWVAAVQDLVPDPKPSWTAGWAELTGPDGQFQREVDMRIGEQLADLFSPERMLRVMHERFRLHGGWIPDRPTPDLPAGLMEARWEMISEEVNVELYRAMMAGDLAGIADAICEAVVTLVGLAIVCGLPFDVLFREVIASNLTKNS